MTPSTDQKSPSRPNEQQGQSNQRSSSQTAISPGRRSSLAGFGFTPQEFFSSPFTLMRRMSEEMDRIFQEFGLQRDARNLTAWTPAIEVAERDGKYTVRAELPGLSPNDVKVEVANDSLVIQGERKIEHEEKDGGVHRTERQYGSFYRSIPLPDGADLEHANAHFQNGLLEVTVPVPEQRQHRRSIPVQGQAKAQETGQKLAA